MATENKRKEETISKTSRASTVLACRKTSVVVKERTGYGRRAFEERGGIRWVAEEGEEGGEKRKEGSAHFIYGSDGNRKGGKFGERLKANSKGSQA